MTHRHRGEIAPKCKFIGIINVANADGDPMTIPTLAAEIPPLRTDDAGAIRVGNSRVLLELVIRAFDDGSTPESIVQRYPTAGLPEVYAAIAYYLRHQDEVRAYIANRERQAEQTRQQIDDRQGDLSSIRRRLLSRRGA